MVAKGLILIALLFFSFVFALTSGCIETQSTEPRESYYGKYRSQYGNTITLGPDNIVIIDEGRDGETRMAYAVEGDKIILNPARPDFNSYCELTTGHTGLICENIRHLSYTPSNEPQFYGRVN